MATSAPSSSSSNQILNLKCFLCTRQFEGERSKTRSASRSGSATAFLTHSASSFFLTHILGIRSDGQKIKRKDLNRLTIKFQKVCYCSQCYELILNACGLMTELEILEEKLSTEKTKIMDKLKESCAKFTENTDGSPPGMLQMLRNEILEEINKNIIRRSVRLLDSPTKNSQNQNVPGEFKIQNWVQSRSTQTETILSAVAVRRRRPTRKVQPDPKNLSSSLYSELDRFAKASVDHDDVNSRTEDHYEIEDFIGKETASASMEKLETSLQRKDKGSDDSVVLDLDSELRNICSQFVVQAPKPMKIVRYVCGTCNERFDDFDSLHAHDSIHKNPTTENISKNKSLDRDIQLHLKNLDSVIGHESPKILKQHSEVSKQDINVSNSTRKSNRISNPAVTISDRPTEPKVLKEKPSGSKGNPKVKVQKSNSKFLKQNCKTSKQNAELLEQKSQVSKEKPYVLRKGSDTLKNQKPKIPRGKVKRRKRLIAGVKPKRASPFYQPKKCEECGKLLSNHDKWRDHVLTIHRCEGKFKCKLCAFTCQFPSKLERHMINRHSETRNYICDLCSKCFKRNDTLQAHRKIHEGKTVHECKLCSCKFAFAVSLRRHLLERTCLNSESQISPRKRTRRP